MSTNYHTPVPFGASNASATVNHPLAELDSAITQLFAGAGGGGGGGGTGGVDEAALRTLTGTNIGDTDLGAFTPPTGTPAVITSTTPTILTALTQLADHASRLRKLTGTNIGDADLNTFTGSIIDDDSTIKQALQKLETAIEGKTGVDPDVARIRTLLGVPAPKTDLGIPSPSWHFIPDNVSFTAALSNLDAVLYNTRNTASDAFSMAQGIQIVIGNYGGPHMGTFAFPSDVDATKYDNVLSDDAIIKYLLGELNEQAVRTRALTGSPQNAVDLGTFLPLPAAVDQQIYEPVIDDHQTIRGALHQLAAQAIRTRNVLGIPQNAVNMGQFPADGGYKGLQLHPILDKMMGVDKDLQESIDDQSEEINDIRSLLKMTEGNPYYQPHVELTSDAFTKGGVSISQWLVPDTLNFLGDQLEDKADLNQPFEVYDPTGTYDKGDILIYGNDLWRVVATGGLDGSTTALPNDPDQIPGVGGDKQIEHMTLTADEIRAEVLNQERFQGGVAQDQVTAKGTVVIEAYANLPTLPNPDVAGHYWIAAEDQNLSALLPNPLDDDTHPGLDSGNVRAGDLIYATRKGYSIINTNAGAGAVDITNVWMTLGLWPLSSGNVPTDMGSISGDAIDILDDAQSVKELFLQVGNEGSRVRDIIGDSYEDDPATTGQKVITTDPPPDHIGIMMYVKDGDGHVIPSIIPDNTDIISAIRHLDRHTRRMIALSGRPAASYDLGPMPVLTDPYKTAPNNKVTNIVSDDVSIWFAIRQLQNSSARLRYTMGGRVDRVGLATFKGSTISDNTTVMGALQELETEVEKKIEASDIADLARLRTLVGVGAPATHLGSFTGSTIPNNRKIKQALQDLETAVEGIDIPGASNGLSLVSGNIELGGTLTKVTRVALDGKGFGLGMGSVSIASTGGPVVIGGNSNTASGAQSGVFAGNTNTASGRNAVALGGQNAVASGLHSATIGGWALKTAGGRAVVVGGNTNEIKNAGNASIVGGRNNLINDGAERSVIIGGGDDTAVADANRILANALDSVIAGGNRNTISQVEAGIFAGRQHTVSAGRGAVLGGVGATVSGLNSIVAGGDGNTASGENTGVVAGKNNTVSGMYSAALGAYNANISRERSAAIGANAATITEPRSVIAGGHANSVKSMDSAIVGGRSNEVAANAPRSVIIGGGDVNTANKNSISSGNNNVIAGGHKHSIEGSGTWSGILAGHANTITGSAGTTTGGRDNNVSGDYSSIVAGRTTTVSGDYSGTLASISGTLSGTNSAIIASGGSTVAETHAAVIGGEGNEVKSGANSGVVVGGHRNILAKTAGSNADDSAIVGGKWNAVNGPRSAIVGGGHGATEAQGNHVSGNNSGVVGGQAITLSSAMAGSVGGNGNNITGNSGGSLGGAVNQIKGLRSAVVGGYKAISDAEDSVVLGGKGGQAKGACSAVIGGGKVDTSNNVVGRGVVNGDRSVVVGGEHNTVDGVNSAIVAGHDNQVDGQVAVVIGGEHNRIRAVGGNNGFSSVILGGYNNQADGYATAVIAGHHNNSHEDAANTAIVAGTDSDIDSGANRAGILGGQGNRISGENSVIIGGNGNSASGVRNAIIGGRSNRTTGENSVVFGGAGNVVTGDTGYAFGNNCEAAERGFTVSLVNPGGNKLGGVIGGAQFCAPGGFQIYSNEQMTAGLRLPPASTSWTILSDKKLKDVVSELDYSEVLARLRHVPVYTWHHKDDESKELLQSGPMADTWNEAFDGLLHRHYDDEQEAHMLSTGDQMAVNLAAVKGLLELVDDQKQQIEWLRERVEALEILQ